MTVLSDITEDELSLMTHDTNTVRKILEICSTSDLTESNIRLANQAYLISSELNYFAGQVEALNCLGLNYYLSADYEKSIYFYRQELNILEKSSYNDKMLYLGECYRMLGEVHRAFKKYDLSFDYLSKAEKLFKKTGNQLGLAKTYNRFASVYIQIPKYYNDTITIEYLNKSNDIAKKHGFNEVIANNTNIYATFYYHSEQFDKALEIYKTSLQQFTDTIGFSEKANVYNNIASTYRKINQTDSALFYARLSFEEAKKNKVNVFIYGAANTLYLIFYEDLKNSDSALVYLQNSITYQGLMFNEDKFRSELQVQFNYESKIKDIEIRRQQETIYYQVTIFLIILFILLSIILLFYYKSKIQKKANLIISTQNEKLKELNDSKDKFFSIVAHDLKNPVGAFKNISVLLHDETNLLSDVEKKEFLELLKESAESLSLLLENLLTWSLSQRNSFPLDPESNELNFFVDNVIMMMKPQAMNKDIELQNEIDENITAFFDANMIHTVLRNLISNSIKFSHNLTTIKIKAHKIKENNSRFVQIDVIDEGEGMSGKQIERIFSLAGNVTTVGTKGETGTGLGMIIVKEFINKNNGRIWIDSEPGKGTTIHFTLPESSITAEQIKI
ncbi:MAG: tetratricopeptide repeat-containing sensor histidine kinase [Candidatus Kapabacteria bacterium]|nr:tetratricopeptide repeat-containing sensor histidine kinase [Candidatus Kapabacteria bacterium]